ncbi:S24 family peptidase [Novosphingobium sp. TH158]|uniref:S24 family peptidase n=1 Tax=Novosphingobium sp. TH158 TaxID=2067455 RepID=UPI000C798741|nr:S24 family peptidase [Novosphingobium sp. TH158]PLK25612.1 transcriptional regulator [Novosphingobium sp. TH158]
MNSVDPRRRLLELAEASGTSLSALSAMLGRNTTYLQQFVRKGSPRKLEENDRRKLSAYFGVPESELGAPEEISRPAPAASRSAASVASHVAVPRLPLDASAGQGAFVGEEVPVDTIFFSTRWLRAQGFDPGKLSAIAVVGDSMEPLLRDGDDILVDHTPRPLHDGIHVVRVGESLLVKRVQTGAGGKIVLESVNPAYRPIELSLDEVEVVGRVVWKGGRI